MKNNILKTILLSAMCILLSGTGALAHDGETLPEEIDAPYGLSRKSYIADLSFTDGKNPSQITFSGSGEGMGNSQVAPIATGDPSGGGYLEIAVTHDGGKVNAFQAHRDTLSGTFKTGDVLVASFWMRAKKIDTYSINSVWLRSLEANRSVGDKRHTIELICDGEWHFYAVPFVMQEDADQVRLMIQFGGQGKSNFTLDVDDIKLRSPSTKPPEKLQVLTANKNVKFTDISGHWAEAAITDMASKGVINGRNAKTFDPEATVTRAEFSAMLVRAIGFRETAAKNKFKDVKATDWYSPYLDILSDTGVIDGSICWMGNFFPEDELKREEMAMFLANAYDKMLDAQTSDFDITRFKDRTEISDWAIIYIMRSIRLELMEGVSYSYFEPQSTVTRAQAATAISNLRTVLESEY